MSIRVCSRLIVVFVALALPASVLAADLRWDLKPGQKLRYEFKTGSKNTTSIMGQNIEQDVRMGYEWTWEVASRRDDGTAHITAVFDRVNVSMSMGPMGEFAYDSEGEEKPSAALASFAALKGLPFEFDISPDGKISNMSGITEGVQKAAKDDDGDAMGKLMAQQFSAMLSDEMFQQTIGEPLSFLPDDSVDEGETWERNQEQTDAGGNQVSSHTTYTVQDLDGAYEGTTCAVIGLEGKVELKMGGNAGLPAGTEITMDEGVGRGQAYFDAATGRAVRFQSEQRMSMTIAMGGGAMKGSMGIRARTTLTLKSAAATHGPQTGEK